MAAVASSRAAQSTSHCQGPVAGRSLPSSACMCVGPRHPQRQAAHQRARHQLLPLESPFSPFFLMETPPMPCMLRLHLSPLHRSPS